jgi:hypothetical protein
LFLLQFGAEREAGVFRIKALVSFMLDADRLTKEQCVSIVQTFIQKWNTNITDDVSFYFHHY